MANSTSNLDLILQSQSAKEQSANAYFDAASPASLFGRRQAGSSGLSFALYGGNLLVDGAFFQVANTIVSLSASTTNYVESDRSGTVFSNTTGFTAGRIPLYECLTGASTVTSYTDRRSWVQPQFIQGRLALAMSDANTTLTAVQSRNQILEFTGTLTAVRDIVVPLEAQQWTVFNNTTGGFGLQFIGATGTGITVAATKRAIIYSDGTNVVRAGADV